MVFVPAVIIFSVGKFKRFGRFEFKANTFFQFLAVNIDTHTVDGVFYPGQFAVAAIAKITLHG